MEETPQQAFWSAPTPPEILPAASVVSDDLRFMLDYWMRLKGERCWPARAEISPKEIRHCLRLVHIYDVVDRGADFRARLVGTGVFPGLEQDQTGRLLSEHPDPGVRLRFRILLDHVVRSGEPARSLSLRVTGRMLHDLRTEGLWLPLGEAAAVEQVLAVSSLTPVAPGTAGFGGSPGKQA